MTDADPFIVLAMVAMLMGAAIVGVVFAFAGAARSGLRSVPEHSATEPRFDARGLPWMPTGDIFETAAPTAPGIADGTAHGTDPEPSRSRWSLRAAPRNAGWADTPSDRRD